MVLWYYSKKLTRTGTLPEVNYNDELRPSVFKGCNGVIYSKEKSMVSDTDR